MPTPGAVRAGVACSNCRSRRVRCDAAARGVPCTRCQQRGSLDCRLLESRRGKYPRRPTQARTRESEVAQPMPASEYIAAIVPLENDEELPRDLPEDETQSRQHVSSEDDVGNPELDLDGSKISWPSIFESFLRSRDGQGVIDDIFITYLGDSFPLALVLEDLRDGGHRLVHQPSPSNPRRALDSTWPSQCPAEAKDADTAYLMSKGAFLLPEATHMDDLLAVFVERVYRFYPVVNLADLRRQYQTRAVPLLLLQSICFVSVSYAPLQTVCAAGWSSRSAAREDIYSKVKALFDTGFEKDKLVILQSITMLTFRAGTPNDTWNFYAWVSMAVTLGETLGIHRSMAMSNLKGKDRSLMKRIWWVLVLRDAYCAILFGRPLRIRNSSFDTEMISVEDFSYDFPTENNIDGSTWLCPAQYLLSASRLALILRDIMRFSFNVHGGAPDGRTTLESLNRAMKDWRKALPLELDWQQDSSTREDYFASALGFMYENNVMLLHLRDSVAQMAADAALDDLNSPSNDALNAAENIAKMANAMVMSDKLMVMPHEIFSSIFLAEAVLYARIRRPAPTLSKLARAQLNICQMAMHEARDFWDSADWVITLYNGLMVRSDNRTHNATGNSELSFILPSAFETPLGEFWPCQLDMFDGSTALNWSL